MRGEVLVVDPVTLGTVVAALISKALDKAENAVVDEGTGVLQRLVGAVRQRFARTNDKAADHALDQVEDAPDSPSRARDLGVMLDEAMASDPEFRAELAGLVEEARRAGVDVGSITQTATGNQNVQIADAHQSTINVTQGSPPLA
jgi:hypothetical protein